jgi:hypothetical protein
MKGLSAHGERNHSRGIEGKSQPRNLSTAPRLYGQKSLVDDHSFYERYHSVATCEVLRHDGKQHRRSRYGIERVNQYDHMDKGYRTRDRMGKLGAVHGIAACALHRGRINSNETMSH